jgi:PAS domain S-box-containing protein
MQQIEERNTYTPTGIPHVSGNCDLSLSREETLQDSEEKYRALYESSSDAIMLLDEKGFFDCNNSTLVIFGFSKKEDFTKVHPADLSPPYQPDGMDSLTAANKNIAEAFSKGTNFFEWMHRRQNGENFPADVLLTAFNFKGKQVLQATVRDLTERKRIENAIKESENKFRSIFDNARDGILLVDIENKKFLTGNKMICQMLGYDIEEIGHIGCMDIHTEESLRCIIDRFERMVRGEISVAENIPVKRKDGSVFYADVNTSPVIIEGKTYLLDIFRDITDLKRAKDELQLAHNELEQRVMKRTSELARAIEALKAEIDGRKQAEELLQESENKFKGIATAAHNAIILMDNDGNIIYWNDAAERIFGYSGQEVLNRKLHSIIVPEKYVDAYRKGLAGFRTTGEGQGIGKTLELEAKRKDGTVFPVELSISALKLNGKWHSTGIVRDITERKQAEEEIKKSKEFVETVLNSMEDSISVIDVNDLRIINVNKNFLDTYGPNKEEVIGKTCYEVTHKRKKPCTPPDDICPLIETLKTGKHSHAEHVHYSDGTKQYEDVSTSPIFDDNGKLIQVIHVAKDITERKMAENELRKAYEELKKTQIQLIKSGKLAAMGELAAGIVHELTEPLVGISGFAAALLEDTNNFKVKSAILEPDIRKFLEQSAADLDMIGQQTDHMTQIISHVRTFAHESRMEKEWNDINPRIENVLALFSKDLRVHNIRVVTNLASGLPRIFCNANELSQVMINLITNARDAMDAKGKGGQFTITTGKSDGGVCIEVEDTGTGADTETVSHMFEPFFSTKNGRMGLGLSIVHRIITDHGGTINVECRQGEGCKFTIRLPSVTGSIHEQQ